MAVQSSQQCLNFHLVPKLFPKDGKFGVYFMTSTGGDIRTVYAKYISFFICSMRLKSFLPQARSHLFAFSVFSTSSFIRSGHLESILHRPLLQFLVAPFLFIRFMFPSLVLSIFLRLSTAFKILRIFVCPHFNPSIQRCFPVSRDNLFLERKQSAIKPVLTLKKPIYVRFNFL